ncbi:GTP-binding protein [Candidatus Woesearchaeota archaeon]|nr:GTP-binding protein [Candidatus Woesearchaeota archaeon]
MYLKTGIPKLDELLDGGIARNKSILFYSSPGVENLPFAYQLLLNRLEQGDHVIYMVNNKKPESVRYMIKNIGWDVSEFEKKDKFAFLDVYSGLLGEKSKEKFSVSDTANIDKIQEELINALRQYKNKNTIVIFDSLSNLLDICGTPEDIIACLHECMPDIKRFNATPIFLFTAWAYDKKTLDKIRTSFDCIIDLKAIERKIILRNYFNVSKASWLRKLRRKDIPFKISRPGGVRVYIPKILVTGPFNAGKTSFIHSASTSAVSVDRLGTTVALDHGHVDFKGFSVDLWGTPGQKRFDPILEQLGSESLGVIVLVDSTSPEGFERARAMFELTKTQGLPSIVAANKSSLKGAMKPVEIRKIMKLPKDIPIIPVSAENPKKAMKNHPCKLKQKDVENILSGLFEMVI